MPITTDLNPALYIINIGGVNISGFADGVFSSFELDEDEVTDVTGSDGYTTRIRSNNNTGLLTLTLLQSSPFNDVLQGFRDLDRTTPKGLPQPIMLKNLLNTELVSSASCWIRKVPTLDNGKEVQNREWAIRIADAIVHAGGNALFQG